MTEARRLRLKAPILAQLDMLEPRFGVRNLKTFSLLRRVRKSATLLFAIGVDV